MDRFQIFADSADATPGKGSGEALVSPPETYAELKKIPHWRRILSNFAVTPFEWKGKQWKTLEHAFQAAKFETIDPALFHSFSLNSGTPLGRGTGKDARDQRKARVFTQEQKVAWDARSGPLMEELWREKFSQNPEARKVLLLTKSAEIWHAAPRTPKVHWKGLERIREELEAQTKEPEGVQMADTPASEENSPAPAPVPPPPAPKKRKTKKAVAEGLVTALPEGALSDENAAILAARDAAMAHLTPPPAEAPDTKESAVKFCPVCRYYLFLSDTQTPDEVKVGRVCRNCGYKEDSLNSGLIMEMNVQEKSTEGYKILLNEFTRRDPLLPHIKKNIKCPDPACSSNHGEESDVIYIKYDSMNMKYVYICNKCGYQWKSGR
jgi:predicted NAD-dependent protein-ADP-ribosyltransferase YbiA (DUF1768 family)/DNA-directed RNA polymerase subunit M/transcription elongation factor TFIIS